MMVHVRPTAQEDILEAARFYDEQEGGLGDRVTDFLEAKVMELGVTAGIHPLQGRFHRVVVDGDFPYYMIYYTLELDGVHVRAVLDHRRDPKHIRRRLRQV
ncbi:MAG: type II toxin-antitoxin system RelE/ParE family toxin [Prosthecobacter sp.]|uniref:type II toxin-antitoxin system RelE/ParE family toxin n=1 Tax=Prosthecobacter sp. TaxID=1965333 RepID=UPI0039039236